MTSRSVRPYVWTLLVLWLLPALAVLVLHVVLPDHNASGQCEGIGFGCTLTPSDGVLFLGFLAAPFLVIAGLVACLVIAFVSSRRNRQVPSTSCPRLARR